MEHPEQPSSPHVGEKRSRPEEPTEETLEPLEKKPKLDDLPQDQPPAPAEAEPAPVPAPAPFVPAVANGEHLAIPQELHTMIPQTSGLPQQDLSLEIEIPVIHAPRGRRRTKKTLEEEYEYEPDSKWNKIATARLIELYTNFGKRRVVEDKFLKEVQECLRKGANPAVTLSSPDGNSFFTYLTVAAERGVRKLVDQLLTEFGSEFSDFDKKHALQAALRNREQEIAEQLINLGAPIDRETIMCLFDIHMNDESERKILPLKAVLARLEAGQLDPNEFFTPEILNHAIFAHNIAALEYLFKLYPDIIRPLLTQATPVVNKTIRAGRGKAQDIGEGVPPLAYAAMLEHPECLEVFLRNGADPNFNCEEMGGTLLHIVGMKNNVELIQLLIEHNADPRIPNSRGLSLLSRIKGRKARKAIKDACAKFDQRDRELSMDAGMGGNSMATFTKLMGMPGHLTGPVLNHMHHHHHLGGHHQQHEDELSDSLMSIPPPGNDLVLPPVLLHDFSFPSAFPPPFPQPPHHHHFPPPH